MRHLRFNELESFPMIGRKSEYFKIVPLLLGNRFGQIINYLSQPSKIIAECLFYRVSRINRYVTRRESD